MFARPEYSCTATSVATDVADEERKPNQFIAQLESSSDKVRKSQTKYNREREVCLKK